MERLTLSSGKHMTRDGVFGLCSDTVTGKVRCEIERPLLSSGIRVLKVLNATITLQVSSKTSTDNQSRLHCGVDFEGHTPLPHEVTINFVYCKLNACDFMLLR